MAENQFQQQFRQFLDKAGEELKRTGEILKTETQRLVEKVRDPENQQKIREELKDLSVWARKAADQTAELIDKAAKKAEQAWAKNLNREDRPASTPPAAEPSEKTEKAAATEPVSTAPRAAKKTVGKSKTGSKAAPRAANKTVGKKKK